MEGQSDKLAKTEMFNSVTAAEVATRPGTIAGIIGPEGSGKTSLMTLLSAGLWELSWDIFCFPGYNLLNRGKPISNIIYPENWVSLPIDLRNLVLDISEADTHFDSMESWATPAKMMRNLAKQRRKRGLTILYDVQDWSWFNNRLRGLTHIIFSCWDMFWSRRLSENPIARGTEIVVTPIDCKGFYTGHPWSRGLPFKFNAKKIWENFDTYETTSPYEAASTARIKIDRRDIKIVGGVVMPGADIAPSVNMKAIEKLAENYGRQPDVLEQVINTFKKQGNIFPADVIREAVRNCGLRLSKVQLGEGIHRLGGYLKPGKNGSPSLYVLDKEKE